MNVALNKKIEEEQVGDSSQATDGKITGYTGRDGFAHFNFPGTLTVDLEKDYDISCIRFLLYDGLGQPNSPRDNRIYKYRLLTSLDHQNWTVIFDNSDYGCNGWQVFNFKDKIKCRYLRIHGLFNSVNQWVHVVEIEAHDNEPPTLSSEIVLQRTITLNELSYEEGEGLPLETKVKSIINQLEGLVRDQGDLLNPEPFNKLTSQLRLQVRDVGAIERSMDSIRREIIDPVKIELKKSKIISWWSLSITIIFGLVGIISLILSIIYNNNIRHVSIRDQSVTPAITNNQSNTYVPTSPKIIKINSGQLYSDSSGITIYITKINVDNTVNLVLIDYSSYPFSILNYAQLSPSFVTQPFPSYNTKTVDNINAGAIIEIGTDNFNKRSIMVTNIYPAEGTCDILIIN